MKPNIYKSKNHRINMKKKSVQNSPSKKFTAVAIATFIVLAFLLGFVNITGKTGVTGSIVTGEATSFVSDMFSGWSEGSLDINISKYLLFFMLTLLIFSIFATVKFPKYTAAQFFIALPIAFLATAYLTPKEIFSVLTAYSALGLTLTILVPFMVMLLFSGALLSTEHIRSLTLGKVMLEIVLWVFFFVFLVYKLIFGMVKGEVSFGINFTTIVLVLVLLISGIILFFNDSFRQKVWKITREISGAKAEAERELREQERRAGEAEERHHRLGTYRGYGE